MYPVVLWACVLFKQKLALLFISGLRLALFPKRGVCRSCPQLSRYPLHRLPLPPGLMGYFFLSRLPVTGAYGAYGFTPPLLTLPRTFWFVSRCGAGCLRGPELYTRKLIGLRDSRMSSSH